MYFFIKFQMTAIQVLEQLPYSDESYPQELTSSEIAMMWLNGMVWKIKNPDIPLVLYTDIATYDLLQDYDILEAWSSVDINLLTQNISINKSVFWANSKFRVYQSLKEQPFIFFDC